MLAPNLFEYRAQQLPPHPTADVLLTTTVIKRALLNNHHCRRDSRQKQFCNAVNIDDKHRHIRAYSGLLFAILSPPLSAPSLSLRPFSIGTTTSFPRSPCARNIAKHAYYLAATAADCAMVARGMTNQYHSVADVRVEACHWFTG